MVAIASYRCPASPGDPARAKHGNTDIAPRYNPGIQGSADTEDLTGHKETEKALIVINPRISIGLLLGFGKRFDYLI